MTGSQLRASFLVTGAAVAAGCGAESSERMIVRPGIDVLLSDSAHLVSEQRVALLTNQTGVDRLGVSSVARLLDAGVDLRVLLSPEHGFRGVLDQEDIGHSVDSVTGLPIYSLYGEVRAPTQEMLEDVDVLLVDLQDIGARTYTYVGTAVATADSAARMGIRVLVLDRPNPIGGAVQGPVPDSSSGSVVSMLPLPLRHGMTIGEMLRFANRELELGADLTVIPVAGWTRSMWHDETGLPWIRPSLNMPDLESATHYPGLVLFEATNLSVGRGTPLAFQLIGAPWLDAEVILNRVGQIPGLGLRDTIFTPARPSDGKYSGMDLRGLRFEVTDRAAYNPVAAAVRLLEAIELYHPELTVNSSRLTLLYGRGSLAERVGESVGIGTWRREWGSQIEEFNRRAAPYLVYGE